LHFSQTFKLNNGLKALLNASQHYQGKKIKETQGYKKDVIFLLTVKYVQKYHLYDPKLQTAEALSIRNRQVSWLAAASVILPAFGSGYAGTETFGVLLTVARQLVIFTRFPINLRYVKPLPFDEVL